MDFFPNELMQTAELCSPMFLGCLQNEPLVSHHDASYTPSARERLQGGVYARRGDIKMLR